MLKSIGILRKIDPLGRIVIPKETRRIFDIHEKDALEIWVEGEKVILQKYMGYGVCAITGEVSSQNMKLAEGKLTVSPEGAKQLMVELERYLEKFEGGKRFHQNRQHYKSRKENTTLA